MPQHDSQKTRVTKLIDDGPKEGRPSSPGETCIIIIYGPDIGRRIPLSSANFEIGRSAKSDLFIDQESISRQHARISCDAKGQYFIEDLNSTNGTFVNDSAVKRQRLYDGDQIHIGRSILKFMTGENIEAHYHEEIYRLMTVDGLTQVFNRRYFDEAMEREFTRARRYARALSLVLFDIDHFKKINDTWGHLAGDGVLRQLVTALRPRLRRADIFSRTGGEEFGVILPEIDVEGARLTAEKLRQIAAEARLRFEQDTIRCTISLGVAMLEPQDTAVDQLYKRADERLYLAKERGRNRVV